MLRKIWNSQTNGYSLEAKYENEKLLTITPTIWTSTDQQKNSINITRNRRKDKPNCWNNWNAKKNEEEQC